MSIPFDFFSSKETQKQEYTQWDLLDNFTPIAEPAVHKKKVHAPGEGQVITIEGIRIDFPLKPCKHSVEPVPASSTNQLLLTQMLLRSR